MQKPNSTKQRFRIFIFATLLISIISISGLAVYAMQSVSIPLEIKEPLEILDYPTSFSLYSGETTTFEFTVENQASVTIFQEFDFTLNDTNYLNSYVTFSNHNYSIPLGINKLQAWLTISPNAPPANFIITINKKTDIPISTPSPTTTPSLNNNITLTPTLELLAGGARWAAQEGNSALYISWKANWEVHHTSDGVNWPYPSELYMNNRQTSVIAVLEKANFDITLAGDLPDDISKYDVLVICGYFALEPNNEPLIRDYVLNGGSVVLVAATPAYLASYSKGLGCTNNLELIEDWFGASRYVNGGGPIKVVVDNPVGSSFVTNEFIFTNEGSGSASAVGSLGSDSEAIAVYESGGVVAFAHEFGAGRVYYQSFFSVVHHK